MGVHYGFTSHVQCINYMTGSHDQVGEGGPGGGGGSGGWSGMCMRNANALELAPTVGKGLHT